MADHPSTTGSSEPTRRQFVGQCVETVVAGSVAGALSEAVPASAADTPPAAGRVRQRVLGKTGLKVSEIGFGGHSWAYARVPVGDGSLRKVTVAEAVEMIRTAQDMGVNFLDSCTPLEESSTPGEALKRLKARDRFIVSIRVSHKMKGRKEDCDEIYKWTETRLKLWQTDCVDLCLL